MPANNPRWEQERKAIRATQLAFELEQEVTRHIQMLAVHDGLTPSSEIRKLLGLGYTPPKRPRLTLSLSADDYAVLAERYDLSANDKAEIRKHIMAELIDISRKQKKQASA